MMRRLQTLFLFFCKFAPLAIYCSAAFAQSPDGPQEKPTDPAPLVQTTSPDLNANLPQRNSKITERLRALDRLANEPLGASQRRKSIVHQCVHIQGATLRKALEEFLTVDGTISENAESDQVLIADVEWNVALLQEMAAQLDRPVPQVLVEARIVELSVDSDFEKEVENILSRLATLNPQTQTLIQSISTVLRTPGANPTTGQGSLMRVNTFKSANYELNQFLRILETRGKAKILSAPNLIIQRGREGMIVTGEEVPILSQTTTGSSVTTSTKFKSVGIKLSVKPLMVTQDTVRVRVSPEVSTVTGFVTAGTVSNPIIAVRQASTELEVKDGELISMAGLLQSVEREIERRVPVLGSIPLAGALFRSKRKEASRTQLVVFLNISILEQGTVDGVQSIDPAEIETAVEERMKEMDSGNKKALPKPNIIQDVIEVVK